MYLAAQDPMVFPFVLLRGEPVFSFLFLSQKELSVQHVKCQLTSFPRKGRVLGFGMVSAVVSAFGQAAVLSGCVHVGVLICGSQKDLHAHSK